MNQDPGISLLKENFRLIENKYDSFFKQGAPRWPGEQQDFLRNHHKHLDSLFAQTVTFERLQVTGLPVEITEDLKLAFNAFKEGRKYE